MKGKRSAASAQKGAAGTGNKKQLKWAEEAFKEFIQENDQPCLGAHSVVNNDGLQLKVYNELGSREAAMALAKDLAAFVVHRNSLEVIWPLLWLFLMDLFICRKESLNSFSGASCSCFMSRIRKRWDKEVSADPEALILVLVLPAKDFLLLACIREAQEKHAAFTGRPWFLTFMSSLNSSGKRINLKKCGT